MHGRCSFFSQQTVYEIFKKLDAPSAADPLSVTIAELSARNVTLHDVITMHMISGDAQE